MRPIPEPDAATRPAGVGAVLRLAIDTLERFPVTMACASFALIASWWASGADEVAEWMVGSAAVGLLGIPLTLALTTWARDRELSSGRRSLLLGTGLVLLLPVLVLWPRWSPQGAWTRWAQIAVAVHLLVAVLPFLGPARLNSFWQYNRALFQRFVYTTLLAGVLFGGLALALAGVGALFDLTIEAGSYWRLFLVVALGFHPWFFLAGIPRDLRALASVTDYPSGLRVLAQYVLTPIAVAYLLILDLYVIRLLLVREMPVRFTAYLTASAAVIGVLSLLLLYPLQVRREHRWIDTWSRWFHLLLVPPIVVLLIHLGRRVAAHGITERRYLVAVLMLWLLGIALFFAVTRTRNIKLIPISLCLLCLLTVFGPWSAHGVSAWDQRARLESLLGEAGMLEADTAVAAGAGGREGEVGPEQRRALIEQVEYLMTSHGARALLPWFDEALRASEIGLDEPDRPYESAFLTRQLLAALDPVGFAWFEGRREEAEPFSFWREQLAVPVDGFEQAAAVSLLPRERGVAGVTLDGGTPRRELLLEGDHLRLSDAGTTVATASLRELVERLGATSAGLVNDPRALVLELDGSRPARLHVERIGGRWLDRRLVVDHLSGILLWNDDPR